MKTIVFVLVLGLGAGAAGGYFARPSVEAHLGDDDGEEVEAQVIAERREDERLVLTLRAGDETFLATFHERADDVAELVSPGDQITVRLSGPGVFADDVPIVHVRRGEGHVAEAEPEPADDEEAAEPGADEPEPADATAPAAPEGDDAPAAPATGAPPADVATAPAPDVAPAT